MGIRAVRRKPRSIISLDRGTVGGTLGPPRVVGAQIDKKRDYHEGIKGLPVSSSGLVAGSFEELAVNRVAVP